ncbi:hypothetical protein E4U44_006300 [Claviceps purpurea]|nr:hypothetical protein E4U44_006300 [Claviceps purpurea]
MARNIELSMGRMAVWFGECDGRMERLLRGNGVFGTRAAPTQSGDNDKRIGTRLDNGQEIEKDGIKYRRYYLQANKDAHDPTLKALAAKNPHAVLSWADVPIAEEPVGESELVIADGGVASKLAKDNKAKNFWSELKKNIVIKT